MCVVFASTPLLSGCGDREPDPIGEGAAPRTDGSGATGGNAMRGNTGGPAQGAGGSSGGVRDASSSPPLASASDGGTTPGGMIPAPRDAATPASDTGPSRLDAGAAAADGASPMGGRDSGGSDAASTVPPPVAKAQCVKDGDCILINDCCNCQAIAREDKAPSCDPKIACLQTACMEFGGVDRPRCSAGRCILALDCDTSTVGCRRAAPACPAGQVPKVVGAGALRCYGECVDARQCAFVPACSGCSKDDLCVHTPEGNRSSSHCVPALAACGTSQGCACAGPAVCAPPTTCSSPAARELVCGM